jgi:hypothetical protein
MGQAALVLGSSLGCDFYPSGAPSRTLDHKLYIAISFAHPSILFSNLLSCREEASSSNHERAAPNASVL